MQRAKVNGVELEYEADGSGEPLLLISPVIANGFLPFTADRSLTERCRVIRYHKRGWGGSTHSDGPASIEEHAADAVALLEHLHLGRTHLGGHSSGGAVALQVAIERPDLVHTLILLEPSPLGLPGAAPLLQRAAPVLQAYEAGRSEEAVVEFLSLVSGLAPGRCREVIEAQVPGAIEEAVRDVDTFFTRELPALLSWQFGPEQAAAVQAPVLSVRGADTDPFWIEVADALRSWCADVEDLVVDGVGHLLHMQRPDEVVRGVAAFLSAHPMAVPEVARMARL